MPTMMDSISESCFEISGKDLPNPTKLYATGAAEEAVVLELMESLRL
jgi:hypothetical protein